MFKTMNPVTAIKARKAARSAQQDEILYELYIAACQEHIGPYIPTPCPVQIWA